MGSTTARDLCAQTSADQARVLAGKGTSVKALRLLALLPRHPMVTIPRAASLLSTSVPTATKAIAYGRYLEILRVGTDLPPDVPRSDVTSSTTHSPSLPHHRETQ